MVRPCEKSITSSSVPWITRTGDVTFGTLSILGNASKNHVRLVAGKATRMPDISGECRITAPTSYLSHSNTIQTNEHLYWLALHAINWPHHQQIMRPRTNRNNIYLLAKSTVGTVPAQMKRQKMWNVTLCRAIERIVVNRPLFAYLYFDHTI